MSSVSRTRVFCCCHVYSLMVMAPFLCRSMCFEFSDCVYIYMYMYMYIYIYIILHIFIHILYNICAYVYRPVSAPISPSKTAPAGPYRPYRWPPCVLNGPVSPYRPLPFSKQQPYSGPVPSRHVGQGSNDNPMFLRLLSQVGVVRRDFRNVARTHNVL